MIALGPFLSASKHPDFIEDDLQHTGFSLELVVDDQHFLHPIYKDVSYWRREKPAFRDFYLGEADIGWPLEFDLRGFHKKQTPNGEELVCISPLLRAIYTDFDLVGQIEDFLREFRSSIWISSNNEPGLPYEPVHEIGLIPELADQGFSVAEVRSYGVTLNVDIVWSFRDEYPGWQKILAGFIEFRPRCGELRTGKWLPLRWRECIEDLFVNRFRSIAPEVPNDSFSPKDLDNILAHFEWMPTTLRSENELRALRIGLVRNSPQNWHDPHELARMLLSEELYSQNTSISQIVRGLPRLIQLARIQEEDSTP